MQDMLLHVHYEAYNYHILWSLWGVTYSVSLVGPANFQIEFHCAPLKGTESAEWD